MARFTGTPGPGRPKGSKNKLSGARLRELFQKLEQERPGLFEEALVRGLQARPPSSFPYLQLAAHYVLGKPKDTLALENVPPLLVVDTLSDADVLAALAVRDES